MSTYCPYAWQFVFNPHTSSKTDSLITRQLGYNINTLSVRMLNTQKKIDASLLFL